MPDANGLYTYVRDGHILVQQGGAGIDLTSGEAGFADTQGRPPVRLSAVPEFIADDPTPCRKRSTSAAATCCNSCVKMPAA